MAYQGRGRGGNSEQKEPHSRKLLAQFAQGPNQIQINEVVFNEGEEERYDIRQWYLNDNDELAPGRGLTISKNKWDKFVDAVNVADSKVK
jgi:hypothetical protein